MFLTSEALVRVAITIGPTDVEGPGSRFAIWVQGCSIRCKGCFNAHLWPSEGGRYEAPSSLLEAALDAGVEGITLLGGEPFEQPEGLSELARLAQQAGLSVMTFTGYTLEHLNRISIDRPEIAELIRSTDLLVDGPYIQARIDKRRPWVGSANQRFHFLTDRYLHLKDQLAGNTIPDKLELRVSISGEVTLNGWGEIEDIENLLEDLDLRLHETTG